MSDARSNWSSKTGMILAATGSAVGLGAIWKFPVSAAPTAVLLFLIRSSWCCFFGVSP